MRDVPIPWDFMDGRLTYRELGVWVALYAHANEWGIIRTETTPIHRLARRAGASGRTFGRILDTLEQKGAITRLMLGDSTRYDIRIYTSLRG